VKKTILLVVGCAALAAVAYSATRLTAQVGGTAAAPQVTKVGVINVGTVFSKYSRALVLKEELQKAFKPFKDKAEQWTKEIILYKDAIDRKDFKVEGKQYSKESLEKAILDRQRALQDLDRDAKAQLGKQQEEQLVHLWKDVNAHIKAYGASKGFHIVMGYGDPTDPKEQDTFANINRHMQGMDVGGLCPIYVAPGLDITDEVVQSLNAAYAANSPTKTSSVTPPKK
jgi:Skp family chaperone for outer membrane proteins